MSIQSVGMNSLSNLDAIAAPPATAASATLNITPASDTGGGAALSPQAQFLSKLQALEQSNPAQASQVLADMATKVKAEAQQATGAQATQLNSLASALQTASTTGNLSGLSSAQQPQGHHGGHHHHHRSGGASNNAQQAAQAYTQSPGSPTSLLATLNSELATTASGAPATTPASTVPASTT